ncbi:MAG TPA: ABC transporter ATP-binding protein [Acidimicrobiales bacterium]|nr:ABC transporter ATP-binding protein [Acidimicrobiales bacterium]
MAAAIQVRDVSKRFRLYHDRFTSLKERVLHMGKVPFEEFWALRDVSLDVEEGQTVGLLGRNGSGKSTLLKCIGAILQPTSGQILVRGSLAAMLELGAGFHPELSGRDNIFLNASLLGLSRKEIERRFDEIVAFAELEAFIDNQVKYYSSGMYTRLGFAVAVNVEPDVLLIDEVLAVGDEAFQRKCIDRVKQFQREGRTIVFVTHAPDYVRQICDWAVVLNGGRVMASAPPGEAIRLFREELARTGEAVPPELEGAEAAPATRPGWRQVAIDHVEVEHPGTGSRPYLLSGEPMTVRASFHAERRVEDAVFSITITDARGELVYKADTAILGRGPTPLEGAGRVVFSFTEVPLLDGAFDVSLGVSSQDGGTLYEWQETCARFEVMNPARTTGSVLLPVSVDVSCDAPGARTASA